MSLRLLEGIGLTKKEIDLYETLLKNGETLPGVLIKQTGLKRATVYKALYALEEKGLVIQRKVEGKTTFIPEPPTKLLEIYEKRVKEEQKVLQDLKSIIPDLTSSYIFSLEKPVTRVLIGIEGLKEFYLDTLREGKTVKMSLTTNSNPGKEMIDWVVNYYRPECQKIGLKGKLIMAEAEWHSYFMKDGTDPLTEYLIVSPEFLAFQHSIGIYGDKVVFVNFTDQENLLAIIVQHPLVAKTMEGWFEMVWEMAKKSAKYIPSQEAK